MLGWLSEKALNIYGWRLVNQPPKLDKYMIIIAPHTSNWDFIYFLLFKFVYKLKISFVGKHTLFVGPFGWYLRKIGGIPVNKSKNLNVVEQIVDTLNNTQKMIFVISPEGTRSYKEYWRSGFYHIALKAKIPIQTCFIDCKTKTIGFDKLIELSGDVEKDLALLKEIYKDRQGIKPELFSKIAFKNNS